MVSGSSSLSVVEATSSVVVASTSVVVLTSTAEGVEEVLFCISSGAGVVVSSVTDVLESDPSDCIDGVFSGHGFDGDTSGVVTCVSVCVLTGAGSTGCAKGVSPVASCAYAFSKSKLVM